MKKEKPMTFLEAAIAVLEERKQPMHFKKITEIAIQKKYLQSKGKTPEWTMGARISTDVKEKSVQSEFVRVSNGKYGLRRWRRSGIPTSLPSVDANIEETSYWLAALDADNFNYDLQNGSIDTLGVKYRMRRTLERLSVDDKIVIYLKKEATFAAIVTVDGELYLDNSDRWPKLSHELEARIAIKVDKALESEARVDAKPMYNTLDVFTQYPEKHRTLALRNGITQLNKSDFNQISEALN